MNLIWSKRSVKSAAELGLNIQVMVLAKLATGWPAITTSSHLRTKRISNEFQIVCSVRA